MSQRSPSIIDKIAGLVPGYKSYARREARRDADKRLRDHVAELLDGSKRHFDDLILELTDAGKLDGIGAADALRRRLGTCADTIRHAERGASGMTDDVVVREEDLERVHEHDLGLLDQARRLVEAINAAKAEGFEEAAGELRSSANELLSSIEQRDNLFREVF